MKLDQLQRIIDNMTPTNWTAIKRGPHWNNPSLEPYEIQYGTDGECIAECVYTEQDAVALVQLRNHASALVECAKLLDEVRQYLPRDHFVVSTASVIPRVDAALKRLEEIKP